MDIFIQLLNRMPCCMEDILIESHKIHSTFIQAAQSHTHMNFFFLDLSSWNKRELS